MKLNKSKLKKIVYVTISDQLNVPVNKINDRSHLVNDLGADSLDIVELAMALEDALGRRIDDSVIQDKRFLVVGNIVKMLNKTDVSIKHVGEFKAQLKINKMTNSQKLMNLFKRKQK